MAGGGVGTSTAPKAAAPIPSGSPLDGSPKFEAAAPVDMNSAPVTAGAGTPTAGTLPATGTTLNGLPPWLSMFTGAGFGGAAPSAGSSYGYKPFVPGTGMSGYGAYRPPSIYTPPSKPATVAADPTKPSTGVPELWDPMTNPWIDTKTGAFKTPTEDQKRMMSWFDMQARNAMYGQTSAGGQ